MIIVDEALAARAHAGRPIRVAIVGAGFMGQGIMLQIETATPGMEVVAIANRHPERAREAFRQAGVQNPATASTAGEVDRAISAQRRAITDDYAIVCEALAVDAVIEVTGSVEFAARVVLAAIAGGKHVILMNAEVDGTVGPILKTYADRQGLVYTNSDGDQPGVQGNLFRFVKGIGAKPVLCGNVKGLHDPYRTPSTQRSFAERWGQNPAMVTSFADGTKISFEQAIVANATGMRVAKRGMLGPSAEGMAIDQAAKLYPLDLLIEHPGIVDYVVGAVPSPGVFVLGRHDDGRQRHYLELFKLGEGPLYCFHTPYHLCHFEVPATVARAVLFSDATLAPAGPPMVEVVAAAKRDLRAGETLDGPGGYCTYGLAENARTAAADKLLPMGLSTECRLRRDVPRDIVLSYRDVELPPGRVSDRLRAEQDARFGG